VLLNIITANKELQFGQMERFFLIATGHINKRMVKELGESQPCFLSCVNFLLSSKTFGTKIYTQAVHSFGCIKIIIVFLL
jgi:hypothetical protein